MGLGWSAALRCNPARRRDRGSKGKGGRGGGGSPGLHKRISGVTDLLKNVSARKVGETAPDGAGLPALYPFPREGGALSEIGRRERQREPGNSAIRDGRFGAGRVSLISATVGALRVSRRRDRPRQQARTQGKAFPFQSGKAALRCESGFARPKEVGGEVVDNFGCLSSFPEPSLLFEIDRWCQVDKLVLGIEGHQRLGI